jgi:hypothetical protein
MRHHLRKPRLELVRKPHKNIEQLRNREIE